MKKKKSSRRRRRIYCFLVTSLSVFALLSVHMYISVCVCKTLASMHAQSIYIRRRSVGRSVGRFSESCEESKCRELRFRKCVTTTQTRLDSAHSHEKLFAFASSEFLLRPFPVEQEKSNQSPNSGKSETTFGERRGKLWEYERVQGRSAERQ